MCVCEDYLLRGQFMTHSDIFKSICDVHSAHDCRSVISSGELPSRLWSTERNKQKHEFELSLIRHITRKRNEIRRANKSTTFNVHGPVHHTNILVYKSQQDAHVTEFIFV
jgi:serine/threonine protein phosphatase PrpC